MSVSKVRQYGAGSVIFFTMISNRVRSFLGGGLLFLLLAGAGSPACAQTALDVPFVPTNQPTVEAMLRLANVGPGDFLIDLGSGDGRIPVTAARLHGARGLGVDLNPQRVREGIENARLAGVADRVTFVQQNLFETDLSRATVITMYLLPRVNLELRPRLLELRPGTRIVSHDFDMADWQPDIKASVRGVSSEVFLWIVPARVAGRWRVQASLPRSPQGFEVELRQKYQEIEGTPSGLSRPGQLRDLRLDGARIAFTLVDEGDFAHRVRFEGLVAGDTIEGVMRGDGTAPRGERPWRAVRARP